jgi:cysteine protease ATG4
VAWVLGSTVGVVPAGGLAWPVPSSGTGADAATLAQFRSAVQDLVWLSYRSAFPAIGHSTHTTDAGWGCMLRSGQMLLAQALLRHVLGARGLATVRPWRWPGPSSVSPSVAVPASVAPAWATYRQVLSWLHDTPASSAPYGIHALAIRGANLGLPVGQWHGPHTTAHVLASLVQAHRPAGLAAVTAIDGTLYCDDVAAAANGKGGPDAPWSAVLLLIPVRLGVVLNPAYLPAITACFSLPQCVGIAGGRVGPALASHLGSSVRT